MSTTFNQTILIGYLGKDPEIFQFGNNPLFVKFQLATNRSWKKDGEKQTRTDWHTIVLYGPTAEAARKYLHKGDKVLVQGELQCRQWETKDGEKRYATCIVGRRLDFLSNKSSQPTNEEKSDDSDHENADIPQDVPF